MDKTAPRPTRRMGVLEGDLARHGFAILEGALDPDTTAAIRARLLAQAAAEKARGRAISNSAVEPDDDVNQWVSFLPNKGEVFRALMNNPACLETVRFILGQDAILSEFSAHITWPGNGAMGLHIDQWWLPHPVMPGQSDYRRAGDISRARQSFGSPQRSNGPINPPVVVNVFYCATEFTRGNGGTRLVPASHLSGAHPEPHGSYDEVQPEVPAGSAVIWDGRTWHARDYLGYLAAS